MNKLLTTSLVVASLLATLPAQTPPEGYQASVRGLPANAGTLGIVGNGWLAYFDGRQLIVDDGSSTRVLLTFSTPVFGAFIVEANSNDLVFGESTTGGVWLVPYIGNTLPPVRLATVNFPYAAASYDPNWVLVSAKTGGLGSADTEVLGVHLHTGHRSPIAVLPGASGPLVVDANQNLYYATASNTYPPPPGSVDVLRFDRTKVQAGFLAGVLGMADATVVYRGLDSAGSMTIDDDDDLFLVDWVNSQVLELDDVSGGATGAAVLLDYANAGVSPVSVQFKTTLIGPAGTQFEPFQPLLAGDLAVHESSFGSLSQVRYVLPDRPRTTASPDPIPPGPFGIATTGGPVHGRGVLALGMSAGGESAIVLRGFEQPLFFGLAAGAPVVLLPANFNGTGTAVASLVNPGFRRPLTVEAQTLFTNATGAIVGTARPVSLVLR